MNKDNILEIVRFSVVGVVVTGVHYGVYLLLQYAINVNIAYTLGYVVAFFINFYLTSLYTFRKKPSWKKGIGFGGAHLFNYLLHMLLLNIFLKMNIPKAMAPIPVYAIAIPVNFIMVRFVFKFKLKKDEK